MLSKLQSLISRSFKSLENPVYGFLVALIVYLILASLGGNPFRVRETAYFNYLADAFLHGQLYLRLQPETVHDLSFFHGHYFLYWPPMPAVVLMPFVAIFGVNFSDVFFTILVASLNVSIVAALLRAADRKSIIQLDAERRALIVLFFALGTVHVVLALVGRVWFTAQELGFLFVSLAYLAAIQLDGATSFWITGLCMACAVLTRNHLIFTGVWPAYYLLRKNWNHRPQLFLHVVYAVLPILTFGLLFLGYNYARFGSPFELGIQYHNMSTFFVEDYQKYGAFNLHYLPINFYYQYVFYPLPLREETFLGGSLFLLSPLFFYAFQAIAKGYRNPDVWAWLLSILATSIPILLLMGTGWVQYGPRYTLDFTVPLLLLTAYGVQQASKRVLTWLTILSILQYIPGILLFTRTIR